MWEVHLPTHIRVGVHKPKNIPLNLNWYRNAHYTELNNIKLMFTEKVTPLIKHLPEMDLIRISYILYPRTRAVLDVANVCCIVDKFFCDTLTSAKIIPDDNHKTIKMVAFGYGEVDSSNPRVEAVIEKL